MATDLFDKLDRDNPEFELLRRKSILEAEIDLLGRFWRSGMKYISDKDLRKYAEAVVLYGEHPCTIVAVVKERLRLEGPIVGCFPAHELYVHDFGVYATLKERQYYVPLPDWMQAIVVSF